MQLIGMLDSPYVRRVAITCRMLGVPFEHRSVSVFRHFDTFRGINPVVKAPTLVCDDGTVLMESTLVIAYVEHVAGRSLMPAQPVAFTQSLHLAGLALAACEKTSQIVYERMRPADKQYANWFERVRAQLFAAYDALERAAVGAQPWFGGDAPMRADVDVAVAWRFTQFNLPEVVEATRYPALAALSQRAEALPEFVATPLD